ncbi:uncharacterized protein [Palaemon carinicauda]|uniref:uncharacterized protein n=1 Tax=Palaemon carinicauda TaxID=392227 RepID=UPI0035B63FF5
MKCKELTGKFGKGSLLLLGIGLLLLTIGIVCAFIGYDDFDDDDEGLLVVGTAIGICSGVFCLICGVLICLCQDCCCCCMRPYPPVISGSVYSQQQQQLQQQQQQQYNNGSQPIHQPLQQQQQQPWQPYLASQSNAGFVEHPPPYEVLPSVHVSQHQGTPLNANVYYPYQEKGTKNDHLTTMNTNTSSSFGTNEDSRGFMPQGYTNPAFPQPQGIAYPCQATVPSAPAMDINPPLYTP